MDYMEIVKRSFRNAWEYKFLWFFGFFASAVNGPGGGQIWTGDIDRGDWDRWGYRCGLHDRIEDFFYHIEPAVIVMAALAILSMIVIVWALYVLSEGALIRGISRKHFDLETGFKDCWSTGLNKFFRIFGITFLAMVSIVMVLIALVMINVPFWILAWQLGLMTTLISIPVFFAFILLVVCLEGWAIRYGILFDESWLSAIGKGWGLLKNNIGKTLGVAFSSFLAQLITWFILVLCVIMLAIPFVILGMYNLWFGLIPGLLIAFLIIVLSSAFFGVFASSVWTIGFMKLTGYSEGQPGAAEAV